MTKTGEELREKKGVGENTFCFLVPKKVNPDETA